MQDPLKQGLKHIKLCRGLPCSTIRMQDPLKQGLKHFVFQAEPFPVFHIRMQDPLKQGLKPYKVVGFKIHIQIRMQDPLKQGLKQNLDA